MSKSFIKGIESSEILKADVYQEWDLIEKLSEQINEIEEGRFIRNLLSHSMVVEWADECGELIELITKASKRLERIETGTKVTIERERSGRYQQSEDFVLKQKLRTMFNLPDWTGKEDIIKAITEKLF